MRRAPRNLRIACDHRGLTHYGGAYFFHEFLQVLQVRDFPGPAPGLPQTQPSIQSVPNDTGSGIPHRVGIGPLGDRVILTFQRYLPIPDRAAELPRSTNVAPFLAPGSRLVFGTDLPRE